MNRWEQSDEQLQQKWNAIFQPKVKDFGGKWTLAYSSNPPAPENWLQPLEETLEMTSKCKECGCVWTSKTGIAYLFFRRNQLEIEGGEVLVHLQSPFCSKCPDKIPLMDVRKEEMDAVLSYLAMELGWYYYHKEYTDQDERDIEKRRIQRKKRKRRAAKTLQPAYQIEEDVPAQNNEAEPPKAQGTSSDKKKITKGKTRWDQTPEEIQLQWRRTFESKFEKFVTANQPEDRWTFKLDKVTKNHPLRREKKWDWFLGEQAVTAYKCEKCNYIWESMRGWVSFWIIRNGPNGQGKLQGGKVIGHVLGQKCEKCPGTSKPYQNGDLYGDEIEAVLSFLIMEIEYWFYGIQNYTEQDEEMIEEKRQRKIHYRWNRSNNGKGGHKSDSCQACQLKVCKKKFSAKYPESPEEVASKQRK